MTMDRNDAWVSLLELFRASLEENGEHDMAIQVPFVGEVHDYRGETFDNKRIQLFSLIAHLLNMVEIKRSVDERRSLESPDMREVEGLFAPQADRSAQSLARAEELWLWQQGGRNVALIATHDQCHLRRHGLYRVKCRAIVPNRFWYALVDLAKDPRTAGPLARSTTLIFNVDAALGEVIGLDFRSAT